MSMTLRLIGDDRDEEKSTRQKSATNYSGYRKDRECGSLAGVLCECRLAVRAAIYRCALRINHSSPTIPFPLISTGSHTMSSVPSTSTSHSNFAPIFDLAFEKYKRKTKQDLTKHPLLPRLQSCGSPEAILTILREQNPEFNQPQNSDDELTKWVTPTVNVMFSFSATLGGAVGLVNITIFPYDIVQSEITF
jgi:hypothetical protein